MQVLGRVNVGNCGFHLLLGPVWDCTLGEKSSGYALLRVDFLADCDSGGRAGICGAGGGVGLAGEGVFPVVFSFVHRFVSPTKEALTTADNSPVRESCCPGFNVGIFVQGGPQSLV